MPGHMYGAIPRTTKTEPETEPEMDTETENGNGNGTFNIRDFGLSTRIRSFVRVIFSVCLSVYFLDIWRFLYLPTHSCNGMMTLEFVWPLLFDIIYLYFEVVRLAYAWSYVRGNTSYEKNETGNGHGHGNGKRKWERNLQYTRFWPEHLYTFVRTCYLLRLSVLPSWN